MRRNCPDYDKEENQKKLLAFMETYVKPEIETDDRNICTSISDVKFAVKKDYFFVTQKQYNG